METLPRSFGRTPKVQRLCSQLVERATQLGAGAKMPTVIALRDELGVSMATLDAALRELEAQQVVIRKHGVGIFVSPQMHQKCVSLVCDSRFLLSAGHSPFWDILLDAARERAQKGGERFELHLAASGDDLGAPLQRGLSRDIAERSVDGIVGVALNGDAVRWIEEKQVPFVAMFGPSFSLQSARVNMDRESFFEMGAEQLHAQGCQRVALWPQQSQDLELARLERAEQTKEWKRVCKKYGLQSAGPSYGSPEKSSSEQGFELARACFAAPRDEWPNGLLLGDDILAHGALMGMRRLGVRVGTDVRVVSHANKGSSVLMGHDEPMTLLEYDPRELVDEAFRLLESLLRGENVSPSVFVGPHLREVADSALPTRAV